MQWRKDKNTEEDIVATARKVEEFIFATEVDANYLLVIKGSLEEHSLDMLCKGDYEGAFYARMQSDVQDRLHIKMMVLVRKLFAEMFTDAELDELIAIYRMPVNKKMREVFPVMQREVLNLYEMLDMEELLETSAGVR